MFHIKLLLLFSFYFACCFGALFYLSVSISKQHWEPKIHCIVSKRATKFVLKEIPTADCRIPTAEYRLPTANCQMSISKMKQINK